MDGRARSTFPSRDALQKNAIRKMQSPRRAFGTVLTEPNGVRASPNVAKSASSTDAAKAACTDATAFQALLAAQTASAALLAVQQASIPPGVNSKLLQASGIELVSQIGEGGFGTVYMARCASTGEARACKMVGHGGDAEEMADIEREVAVHGRLGSSNGSSFFVHLHVHFTEPMRSIIVMEMCAGVELEEYILRQPHSRLSERDARPLAALLAAALTHCHDAGVVHLDVTPRNVLVDHADPPTDPRLVQLKLIDCAIAPVPNPSKRKPRSALRPTLAAYAALPMLRCQCCTADGRSDVRALFRISRGADGGANFVGVTVEGPMRAAGEETSEHDIRQAMRGLVRERGGAPNYRSPERHLSDDFEGEDRDDQGGEDGAGGDGDDAGFFRGEPADVYSFGGILYFMLTGRDAFDWAALEEREGSDDEGSEDEKEDEEALAQRAARRETLLHDIEAGAIAFDPRSVGANPPSTAEVSEEARCLIRRCMAFAPEKRPAARELVAAEAWFVEKAPAEDDATTDDLIDGLGALALGL